MLIVLSGLPGTGKSSVADAVGRARGLPVLSVDPIESALLRAGIAASFETGLAAYLVVEVLADSMLATGISPIVDAVNSVEVARDMWRRLSAKHGVSLIVVECTVSDSALHASRLAVRERGLALAEPTGETVDSRRAEWAPWTDPHLTLDGVDDLAENVRRVLAELDRASR